MSSVEVLFCSSIFFSIDVRRAGSRSYRDRGYRDSLCQQEPVIDERADRASRSMRKRLCNVRAAHHRPCIATLPNGLPSAQWLGYTRRLCNFRLRVLPTMEINPILNSIKDLSERSETIRGYL